MNTPHIEQTLRALIETLNSLAIPYHLTGGLVVSYYGTPRMTQDIDLVTQINAEQSAKLIDALSKEFIIDEQSATRLIREGRMFQALHEECMFKVDFHVGEAIPGELSRSQEVAILPDLQCKIASKEDCIVSKVLWASKGSGKSVQDLEGLLRESQGFDQELVQGLCESLSISQKWKEISGKLFEG